MANMQVTQREAFRADQIPLVTADLLRDIGEWAATTIRARTARGVAVDGTPFQPLSDGYAKAKAKAGLGSRPNLTVSGRMFNDLAVRLLENRRGVELRFISRGGRATGQTFIQRSRAVGAADKAYWHHTSGAGRSRVTRPFFDLNAQELNTVQQMVAAHLDRVTR